jgi:hypothetical protein
MPTKKPAKKKKAGGGGKVSSQTPVFGSIEDGDMEVHEPQPCTLNPKPSTLNLRPYTLDPGP